LFAKGSCCKAAEGINGFFLTHFSFEKEKCAPKRKLARGSKKPPLALPKEAYKVEPVKYTAHPYMGICLSAATKYLYGVAPANSILGMSRYSVAKTHLINLGGMGGGFLEPPMIFLSLAPFLSFSKKERNGERKKTIPHKNREGQAPPGLTVFYSTLTTPSSRMVTVMPSLT